MRVMNFTKDAHFSFEATAVIGIEVGGHHFDGDGAGSVGFIVGLPDLAHASLADTDRKTVTMIEKQVRLGLRHRILV
jgi:hypothetical protein